MAPSRTRLYAIIIITVFSFIIVTGIGNFRAKQLAVDLTGNLVTQAVQNAAVSLNGEKVWELAQTMNDQDPYYREMRSSLMDIKNTHALENLAILYKDESKAQWYHLADTREQGDPAHNTLGKTEKSVSASVEKTIRGKVVQGEYRVTSQGPLVSSYQVIKDPQGKNFAVLIGDFNAAALTDFLYLTRYAQFGMIALMLLFLGVTILLTRKRE